MHPLTLINFSNADVFGNIPSYKLICYSYEYFSLIREYVSIKSTTSVDVLKLFVVRNFFYDRAYASNG